MGGAGDARRSVMARVWWALGQVCLVRARRAELRAMASNDILVTLAEFKAANGWKKKAEEFFQRIGGSDASCR